MAPNRRGAPPKGTADGDGGGTIHDGEGMISKAEVEARGSGTKEERDSYDFDKPWKSEQRVFLSGLMFLTRLPCPKWVDHHPAYLMRSLQWFPLLGAAIGGWAAAWLSAAGVLWGPAIAAAASTLATVWLTGCFHEDGLADCFDGFGGGWGRAQILRIMKDSRIGTYALVGTSLILYLKLQALQALVGADGGGAPVAAAALVAAHAASRWTSLPLIYCCHYIQDEDDAKKGLYNWFAQSQRLLTPWRLVVGTATAVAVPWAALGLRSALLMYAAVLLVTLGAGYYGNAILGGVVGDYLGATIQVAELCCYLALAADWAAVAAGWRPLAALAAVAAAPVLYSRRIVEFGSPC